MSLNKLFKKTQVTLMTFESFILKETPPETRETLLLFPNLMTTIQLLHLIQLQDFFSVARK